MIVKDLSGLKVLVADDDAIAQLFLKTFLNELGCVVTVVSNGFEALKIILKKKFDFALVDINMPKTDGIELVKSVRNSNAETKNIPIIGITADESKEIEEKAKKAGMTYLMTKPINMGQLKYFLKKSIQSEEVGQTAS